MWLVQGCCIIVMAHWHVPFLTYIFLLTYTFPLPYIDPNMLYEKFT